VLRVNPSNIEGGILMKRTIAFVLATIMLIGLLAGCNTDNSSDATNNPSGNINNKVLILKRNRGS
jgi:hypothetical protein